MLKDADIPVGYSDSIKRESELVPDEQLEKIRTLAPQIAATNGLDWIHGFTLTNNQIDGAHTSHDFFPGSDGLVARTRTPIDYYHGGEIRKERYIPDFGQPTARYVRAHPRVEEWEWTESWPIAVYRNDFNHLIRLLTHKDSMVSPRRSERVDTGGSFGESGRQLAAARERELRQRRFPLLSALKEGITSRLKRLPAVLPQSYHQCVRLVGM